MPTARDSVRTTAPAVEVLSGLIGKHPRKATKNGPVEHRNHLEILSADLRAFVLDRCGLRGVPVTAVRVVSATEVIVP
jgi:hypothetical protein